MNVDKVKTEYYVSFSPAERVALTKACRRGISDCRRNIDRIANSPRNEGQATYSYRIDEERRSIRFLEMLIDFLK